MLDAITARNTDDLLDLVPHLLGFHPAESLVIMLVEGGHVAVTARLDVTDARAPGAVAELMARMRARFPSSVAWCVAYAADARAAWQCLQLCERAAPSAILGVVHVDGTSWWPSPGGPPHARGPHAGATSVRAEQAGLFALASRAQLAATVDGPPPGHIPELEKVFDRERVRLSTSPTSRWPAAMRATLASASAATMTDELRARLALLARHPHARDAALLALTPTSAPRHADVWQQVVRRCLHRYQAHPLCLLGMAAWVSGNGALSSICLERARALDRQPPLLAVLTGITQAVLPPSAWPGIRRDLARRLRNGPQSSP